MSKQLKPNYIFEISWEVCNKVGGIHTVISTKAPLIEKELKHNYILIGPDIWQQTKENPEFIEDKNLFKAWQERAAKAGLKFRVGRWNISCKPIALLVDFHQYIPKKDEILAEFWEKYKLDSITGSWDYIEPALFGYAAGKVIESFYEYHNSLQDRIIAHFHEWMTGGGVLYLKNRVPQIGLVFTTHATVLGRCIANNQLPLYDKLETYNSNIISETFNVKAKHSLEYIAANQSDSFSTVSGITARECQHFLERFPDEITPNGIEEALIESETKDKVSKESRERLLNIAEALTGATFNEKTILLGTSGRYEFTNKGIDVFIDALSKIDESSEIESLVAYIMVPAYNSGAVQPLVDRINGNDTHQSDEKYLTHSLFNAHDDVILNKLKSKNLLNSPENKVKVVFVPSYLNGNDGVFNIEYYDLLKGFDLTIFPSYYEPWGYTPLESVAKAIPTITTSLAGFGVWCKEIENNKGVFVVERNDSNYEEVVNNVVRIINDFSNANQDARNGMSLSAVNIAKQALWETQIEHYENLFSIALNKVKDRKVDYMHARLVENQPVIANGGLSKPDWKKILIKLKVPQELEGLFELSKNFYWCWNTDAQELFNSISPQKWKDSQNNPIALLESLSKSEIDGLCNNKDFLKKLEVVYGRFKAYMAEKPEKDYPSVAYFSMEFGLHESLQIYSGGLGVLAGDYLKEASDSNVNMIGVGLLYRYGYFSQSFSPSGDQISNYYPHKFSQLPLIPVRNENGDWITINISIPGSNLKAKIWEVKVGRIPLYLLDTDIEENSEADKAITYQLYGGDLLNRFKQEILLGIGGIRMLQAMNLEPQIYHCNEGHAAFIGLERLRNLIQEKGLLYAEAEEVVKSSTIFTTHTPVPAGHDEFPEDILRAYLYHYSDILGIPWEKLMNLGRWHENNTSEKFSMSVLAAKLSQEMNAVSRIHCRVTREMFNGLYKGFYESESHIGYVTNGVHYPTWTNKKWQALYEKYFDNKFLKNQAEEKYWSNIHEVPNKEIWTIRQALRCELISFIKKQMNENMGSSQMSPRQIIETKDILNPNALTIGFARRFATYKRADLIFSNLKKLASILNNEKHPVQIIFSGKAHPRDKAGADLIKRIIEISKMPEFLGKIVFLENYNMSIARKLIQGVDIWLNNPTRPQEASGTSGEKAIMNGIMNLSVLDGWWAEGYKPGAGWALDEKKVFMNQKFQDELDAETIYDLLEDEIVPLFYNRDENGVPNDWIMHIKNTIAQITPNFTMKRQLDDYYEKFYNKLFIRSEMMNKENFSNAKELADWKFRMIKFWDDIVIEKIEYPDSTARPLELGENFNAIIDISTGAIKPENLKVEMVIGQKEHDQIKEPKDIIEMKLVKHNNNIATFELDLETTESGVYDFAFRITPKHKLLAYSQDINLVMWA